ncbi:DUF799 domain-containing protein [Bordetella hinzii]|uniref:Lipoprotein n=2 Tax=Bordetella hinzii TaxID=103855 RepID=A0AAN1VFK1_9BORD|nr:DUF799 domain-containing protein [Bordetella hinzii]AKQ57675.1 Putative lipoprotein precursor [Bordetella hinzii]AKQ62142.1 Putative lipoprotein precursor [Bordetella hinzii]AZW16949.1 hypothetical protein CS347_09280 [Bordetella hinzii]KCB23571.1 lipoprotein, PF05643 family [Bordetella hinzii OH87 BAL007II]KCB28700.1 lipoprotein, PF05643 family [Bordetella hinzii L60]
MIRTLFRAGLVAALAVLTGCVAAPQRNVDYSAFRESKPASILVLPPLNESVEPAASAAVLAQVTYPLAESGYYVVPVAVMDETFRQNGMMSPDDAHQVPPAKLREIFGADAALYLRVKQYGSSYQLLGSVTTVAVDASLVDLRTGAQLWEGTKTVAQAGNGGQGGILGMLVQAVVDQVVNTLTDRAYGVAALTNQQLLMAGTEGGLLYGPRSPHYEFK